MKKPLARPKAERPAKPVRAPRTRAPEPPAAAVLPATASKRAARAAERRAAIIAAGLQEFVARGYAATRLDDVAKRAGVAKGTIYLHFKDKEALFQELIRSALVPVVSRVGNLPTGGASARALLESFAETFVREVAGTQRADILRLIISEGARFPSLAEFHYREVVSRGVAGITQLIQYGIARGEIRNTALAQFPQIVVAPALVAVIWQGLFGRFAPLDTAAMLRAHLDLIFGEETSP
jgi:AcrR family transcriptional regulator